ncbi:MAG: metallophosphoesterase [Puniceicoccales bacterium]|nr:metallophosphoesterase [Puniceicoccales bacterium]
MMLAISDVVSLCLIRQPNSHIKIYMNLTGIILSFLFCIYGYFHAKDIKLKNYDISIGKDAGDLKDLKAVFIADMHLGEMIKAPELDAIITQINSLNPDIVFFGGDIYDENTPKDLEEYSFNAWHRVESKYGTYYVGGNHEYGISKRINMQRVLPQLAKNKVHVLQDESVLIGDAFYLIGRKDAFVEGRASLVELTRKLDKNRLTILLDHQPVELLKAKEAGIDLFLSGHTHGGQIFPIGLLSKLFSKNELLYGYQKLDTLQTVVSSGVGVWGFPMRVGTNSEIVVLNIKLKNKENVSS